MALKKIIDTQHTVIDFQNKKKKQTDLFNILLVVDDFSDDRKFGRYSSLLHGVHLQSQKYKRSQCTFGREFRIGV